jgi:hypothetical protein
LNSSSIDGSGVLSFEFRSSPRARGPNLLRSLPLARE